MNQVGIWMNDKEYICDVNEYTTCDEVIRLLIKPPAFVKETPLEVNACEYKLDQLLFAEQSDSSNNSSNGNMDGDRLSTCRISNKSSITRVYDSRIQELSQRISLLDSTIEVYDNSDVEDGLSEEEIIENQITRMGILLKKQSIIIKNILKQNNTACLYTEKIAKEKLLAELEKDYSQMKMFDCQLQRLQSTLDVLNWKSNKHNVNLEQHSKFRTKNCDTCCSSKTPRNKFTTVHESNRTTGVLNDTQSQLQDCSISGGELQDCSTSGGKCLVHEVHIVRDNHGHCGEDMKDRPPGADDVDITDNETGILTKKDLLSLTFGLKDEESSILV